MDSLFHLLKQKKEMNSTYFYKRPKMVKKLFGLIKNMDDMTTLEKKNGAEKASGEQKLYVIAGYRPLTSNNDESVRNKLNICNSASPGSG